MKKRRRRRRRRSYVGSDYCTYVIIV